ncbi:MAG: DUF72 domain-containing protein [Myxococcota bacterium]|nr:DUF72 domain-containing protein [Myxococcota bacterium]
MTNIKHRVGTVDYPAGKKRVLSSVDVVELTATYQTRVKPATAQKWRSEVPHHVSFVVQAPKYLYASPPPKTPLPGDAQAYGGFQVTEENLGLWQGVTGVAKNLNSEIIVLITPAEFTPTRANQDALAAFIEAARVRSPGSYTIVWAPKGLWEPKQAAQLAASRDMILAVDPLQDPLPTLGDDTAYFRLGPFAAMGSRMGVYDLERLKDAMTAFDTATTVFQTPRALDDARNLKQILAE